MKILWSILYSSDWGRIFQCGPFPSRDEAIAYAKRVNVGEGKNMVDTEFDITDTHVYVMGPDHKLEELEESDLA
jgi:hypothetical protein